MEEILIKHQSGEQIDRKTDLKLYNREERQRTLKKENNHWIWEDWNAIGLKKKKEIPEADTEQAVTNVENFNIGYSC